MKKRIAAWGCLVFLVSLLSGCGCTHQWEDATCLAPKTCALCQRTEGEALGHRWQEATCTAAKTCTLCHATEGEALGHSEGGWEISETDPVEAVAHSEKRCSTCGTLLDKKTEDLEQLHQDDYFLLSANQFIQRLNDQLALCGATNLKAVGQSAENQFICWLYEGSHLVGYVQFYVNNSGVVSPDHGDDTPYMGTMGLITGSDIASSIVPAWIMTVDPTLQTQTDALLFGMQILNNAGNLSSRNGIYYVANGFSYGGQEQGMYYDSGLVFGAMLKVYQS